MHRDGLDHLDPFAGYSARLAMHVLDLRLGAMFAAFFRHPVLD